MTINTYDIGDRVILSAAFEVADVATDPTATSFVVRPAGGQAVTYTLGSDDRVERDSAGVFTCWVEPDRHGDWHWAAVGTGPAKGAEERIFRVREPKARR